MFFANSPPHCRGPEPPQVSPMAQGLAGVCANQAARPVAHAATGSRFAGRCAPDGGIDFGDGALHLGHIQIGLDAAHARAEREVVAGKLGLAVAGDADVALMADDLSRLPFAVDLSRSTRRIIMQNLIVSLGIVAVLVPATIMGLGIGAAVAVHEGSTLLVVFNALRLLAHKDRFATAGPAATTGHLR